MKNGRIVLGVLLIAVLACGFAWASGADEGPGAAEGASKFKGEISMYSSGYTPNIDQGPNLPQLTQLAVLADKYMEMYPGVKIEFIERPESDQDYQAWVVTQIAGGTIPDIIFGHATELEQYAPEGWFVDWMPYLQQPNPYIPGNKQWYDIFGKKLVELRRSPDGALWSLPVCMVATIIYYNKDIFEEVGVSAPATWEEFLTVQRKLKDAGHTPLLFDMSTSMHLSWSYRVAISHFYEDKMKDIDVLGAGPDDVVSAEEFARAVKKGLIAATDPEHKATLALYPEWSNYWQKGYLTKPAPGIFEQGKTAMWWHGIWQMVPLLSDPLIDFEIGTFYAPQITTETSEYSTGELMRMIGGASGEQWAITKTAIDNDTVDLCVDWIHYLTVPDNINAILEEAKKHAPLIKGGDVLDMFAPFVDQAEAGVSPFIVERFFSTQQRDEWFREFQLFMSGEYTVDTFAVKVDDIWNEAADELIGKHEYSQAAW
jgi:raffinose/stachyose/melibiose transport system substrate-binding protein